jgi:6-phosphogluconolactonase (cycloisomerase 2 family)
MHLSDSRFAMLRAMALAVCVGATVAACGPAGLDGAGDSITSSSGGGNGSINGGSSGASSVSYTVGGSISGVSGSGLILANNVGDDLAITGNGGFTFSNSLASGAAYAVTIKSQPTNPSQICTVMDGTGTVSTVNVNSVTVSCTTDFYTVGVTVSGVIGSGLVLQTNGSNNVAITSGGNYTLATLESGSNYTITVMTQPTSPSQTCSIANGTGMVTNANVTGIAVSCGNNNFTIGGSVTGLSGNGLVLQTNGANNFPVSASGPYVFATLPSGTAYNVTVLSQPTNPAQTCVVTNGTGTVINADTASVAVACTGGGNTVGGTVSNLTGAGLVLQDNGGDNLPVTANGGFTFATRLLNGTPYAVTVKTQPSGPAQYCSVTNGTGTMAAANVTNVTVTCRTDGRYAFVSDFNSSTVAAFTIDFLTGSLALVNTTPSDVNPNAIAVTPNGAFAYTANSGAADVSIFAVNAATGALTAAGTAATGVGSVPSAIVVDPSGDFVLVTDSSGGTVLVFQINPISGALTQVPGSPFGTPFSPGGHPSSVVVDPLDRFSYLTDQFAPAVVGFTFNAISGDLTPLASSPFGAGNNPRGASIDPSDRFLYVANKTDGDVSGWTIDSATGALTAVAGSPFAAGFTGGAVAGVTAIDPTGQFLYVTDTANNQVVAFTINQTTGALAAMAGSPFGAGGGAFPVAIDPSGQFLYVGNNSDGTLSMYTVNPNTGALTAVPGSPRIYGGTSPSGIAIE